MLYEQRQFTLPASQNTSEKKWDLATLTPAEFRVKYEVTEEEYELLAKNGVD